MRKLLIGAGLLAPLTLAAMGSSTAFAQQQDWGKWQPAGGAKADGTPISKDGITYGTNQCQPSRLSGRHAYWMCASHCTNPNGSFCWEARSDAIYTCEKEPGGYRRLEWFRTTDQPCGPEDWKRTVHVAEDIYHETWTKNVKGAPEQPGTTAKPPTTDEGLPPTDDEHKPSWGGGTPPWHQEPTEKKDESKTDQGKTDQGKTDQGKTDQGKTDQGKSGSGKSDQGNPGQGKTETPTPKPSEKKVEKETHDLSPKVEHRVAPSRLTAVRHGTTSRLRTYLHAAPSGSDNAESVHSGGLAIGGLEGLAAMGMSGFSVFGGMHEHGFGRMREHGFGGMHEGGFGGMHEGGFGGVGSMGGFFKH